MKKLNLCGYYEDGEVKIENDVSEDYNEDYDEGEVIEIDGKEMLFNVMSDKLNELREYMKGCGFEFGEDDVDNEFFGWVMGLDVKKVVVWSVEYDMSICVEYDG